jgi:hypothetical protein
MKTDNAIKLGIEKALKDAQFQRKSSTWYRDLEETVLVVDLQKSNFGQQYYVNLGVMVKGLPANHGGGNLPPKENQCHIRVRIEALKPEEEDQLKGMLNLEDGSIGVVERQERIAGAIKHVALPFLNQCSTRAGIRDADRRGQLGPALVYKSVRDSILS